MRENLDWHGDPQGRDQIPGRSAIGAPAQDQAQRVAQLFKSHNRALRRFLICRLRSAQDVRATVREAYVQFLQLDAPTGITYLEAFLFKTAAHPATERLTNASRRGRTERRKRLHITEITRVKASADQQLPTVIQALKDLPPKCRYAFIMNRCYRHDLSEVAQLMDLSERMIRIYVERALTFCSEQLIAEGERK